MIKVMQAGSLAGCLVVVAEWLQAMPLPEYLKEFPSGVVLALQLIDQIAEALAWYHERGITLGPFKTDSVLILPDGRPIISGMSLTDLVSGQNPPATETNMRVYMAPETQGASIEIADPLVDIFSFVTVAYEILTTQLPTGMFAVAPSDHTGAGKWLDEIVYKFRHPKAVGRTQSLGEFRKAIEVIPKVPKPRQNLDRENLLGMQFSPVPNTSSILSGTREFTEFEYQIYLKNINASSVKATESDALASLKPAIVTRKQAKEFSKWLTEKDRFR